MEHLDIKYTDQERDVTWARAFNWVSFYSDLILLLGNSFHQSWWHPASIISPSLFCFTRKRRDRQNVPLAEFPLSGKQPAFFWKVHYLCLITLRRHTRKGYFCAKSTCVVAAPPPWTNIRLPGMFKSDSEISVEEQNAVINNCFLVLDM